VGDKRRELYLKEFNSLLKKINVTDKDIIVINGGEPSIHSEFKEWLYALSGYPCNCKIYTNGRKLNNLEGNIGNNIEFIIPIHGTEIVHDSQTRVKGAFRETVISLRYLQNKNINYGLKFIISNEMMLEEFDIAEFLNHYSLLPQEIYIARMNSTIKSKQNKYTMPSKHEEKSYLNGQLKILSMLNYKLKILDFPPCYLENSVVMCDDKIFDDVSFVFNDYKHFMEERVYKKERWKENCDDCLYNNLCNEICQTYYVIVYKRNGISKLELE
jgi:MoaA/NifB/PqqE/SkfB family radical SAM enzyme